MSILLASAYILKFKNGGEHNHYHHHNSVKRFKVTGMRCNHCKANIEKAIWGIANVTAVTIELSSGIVDVEGDIAPTEVCSVVKQLGFEIEKAN